jgi:hypothetical protein
LFKAFVVSELLCVLCVLYGSTTFFSSLPDRPPRRRSARHPEDAQRPQDDEQGRIFSAMPPDPLRAERRELLDAADDALRSDDPAHLRRRIALLDQLERHLDRDAELLSLRDALETANARVYDAMRAAIRRGDGRATLNAWLGMAGAEQPTVDARDGYDHLDEIVAGILQLDEPDTPTVEPTAEMVFYQPTPARHILDFIQRTALGADDVLIDLGAGLGHVAILTAICTEARAVGVELEPAYVACARRAAKRLNVSSVTFIEADARRAPLEEGTVFFLYTPFSGGMLRDMLDALRNEAERRPIRVGSFGPCTRTIAAEDWLEAVDPPEAGRVTIFRSC